MSGVHHFVPVLHRGDAVGRHTLRLRDATRHRGIESNIFVDVVQDETADETLPAIAYAEAAQGGDVVVYQFATASLMAPWLAGRTETLVVNYHNITPRLMAPWDHHLALGQDRAREDLAVLAPRTALAIADSAYNETHLAESGFAATAVVPPSAALSDEVGTAPSPEAVRAQGGRGGGVWLAVGRVAPNKALEHSIAALAVAREHADPGATLRIVGKPATDTYEHALRRYVADLGLEHAVSFSGYASDAAVAAAYRTADVLVVTSEHEGFCVPVVEAMAAGLPVVAFDRGAVPEVLGGAGILVTSRDPYALAEAIGSVLGDPLRRAELAEAGRRRLAELDLPNAADRFVDLLCGLRDLTRGEATMSAIHQFVPMLHRDDAVGRHTLRLRDVLVSHGIESRIYVEMIDPDTEAETRLFPRYADEAQRGDVLLYQFATASAIASWLGERRETLAVNYHNVTPPEYYAAWNNPMARHQLRALHERTNLAPRTSLAIAVSAFNEAELRSAGYAHTAVVPPAAVAPTTAVAGGPTGRTDAGARWICIGRVAPNKGIELALMALLVAPAHHDPGVTLEVVGRPVVPAYSRALERFAAELGLRDAVTFRGGISDADLVRAMATSDALIMASRHEGFGVPVIEAMTMGLPVVANAEGALPEVIGDAGVLVDATDPYTLAAAAARVVSDEELRRALAQAGLRRVQALDLATAGDRAVDLIAALAR